MRRMRRANLPGPTMLFECISVPDFGGRRHVPETIHFIIPASVSFMESAQIW